MKTMHKNSDLQVKTTKLNSKNALRISDFIRGPKNYQV